MSNIVAQSASSDMFTVMEKAYKFRIYPNKEQEILSQIT